MATPINFIEANGINTGYDGLLIPVFERPTTLGDEPTTEVISAWQMSDEEAAEVNSSGGVVFLTIIGCQPPCEVLGGDPVPFEGQNRVYTHPECRDLPTYQGPRTYAGQATFSVTSAWQLTADGLKNFAGNGNTVFVRFVGGQPPVEVSAFNPIL